MTANGGMHKIIDHPPVPSLSFFTSYTIRLIVSILSRIVSCLLINPT